MTGCRWRQGFEWGEYFPRSKRALAFTVAAILTMPASAAELRAVDGDTLAMGKERIRLHGIDAPEADQLCNAGGAPWPCGALATQALAALIAGKPVTCNRVDRDRYGRMVATCAAGGADIGAAMVEAGWAMAYRRYSCAYVAQEDRARAARVGIWQGDFTPPWAYRKPGADGGNC